MKLFYTFIISLCGSLLFSSCSLLQPATTSYARQSKEPKFMNDVSLGSSRATGSMEFEASHVSAETHSSSSHNATIVAKKADVGTLLTKYADKLSLDPKLMSNASLYSFIEEWYGTPYRMGGNDKNGIDCSAFAQKLYEEVFGTSILRSSFEQFSMCQEVCERQDLKEGDLVFFRRGKRISHVGVYLANDHFVHASTSQGVTVSSLNEQYWKRNYAGAGKIPVPKDSL